MANSRIFADSFYVNGVAIPASYFLALDEAQDAALDGDAGGTWAPSSGIQIGGAGMWCAGSWTLAPPSAGTVQVTITPSAPMTHGDSDYIELNNGDLTPRSLQTPCDLGKDASGISTLSSQIPQVGQPVIAGACAVMIQSGAISAPGPAARINGLASSSYRPGGRIVMPLRVHDGGTLFAVTFYFQIAMHSSLPLVFPQFRVHKVDIAGNLTPLYTGANQVQGFKALVASTVGAYNSFTSFEYFCDANVVIDRSTYAYFAEIIDESGGSGAMSNNAWQAATASITHIADMRPD